MARVIGYEKVYVTVLVQFDPAGKKTPAALIWEDGSLLPIDRVLDERPAASLKAGGIGDRYTVRIRGKERYLWYEDPAWFVEKPVIGN